MAARRGARGTKGTSRARKPAAAARPSTRASSSGAKPSDSRGLTLTDLALAIAGHADLTEKEREVLPGLIGAALLARRAGVVPTLEQLAVSALELEAWVAAGRLFEVERPRARGSLRDLMQQELIRRAPELERRIDLIGRS